MWSRRTVASPLYAASSGAAPTPRLSRDQDPVSLDEAIRRFLERGEARNLSPRTLQFYRERLGVFRAWLDAERLPTVAPHDLTASTIRNFLAHERERTSPATAKHAHAALSALFGFLVKEQAVPRNVMRDVEKPRTPRRIPSPLTADEVGRMLATCGKGFTGARLKALLLVMVDTGLRLSEVCGLRLEDVSLGEQTLKVMGKAAKERVVPFGQATKTALLDYLARRGGSVAHGRLWLTVYGDPLPPRQVHKLLADCGKRAGVNGVHPHRMRHTFALLYLKRGGDAFTLQRALGHSSLEMTKRYCAVADTDLREAHRRASPGDLFTAQVKPTTGRRRTR